LKFTGLSEVLADDGGSKYIQTTVNFYQTTQRYNQKTAIFISATVATSHPTINNKLIDKKKNDDYNNLFEIQET
jgi:hypothetical protein